MTDDAWAFLPPARAAAPAPIRSSASATAPTCATLLGTSVAAGNGGLDLGIGFSALPHPLSARTDVRNSPLRPTMERLCSEPLSIALLLACLLISGSSAGYTPQQIEAECKACDTAALSYIQTYQNNFGTYARAIDGAKYHCSRFTSVYNCYTTCLHDTVFTYSSGMKATFMTFYKINCDPVCYMSVLPWCFVKTVGRYDRTLSCNGDLIRSDLKNCLVTELFGKQNCTGACTPGQRQANFFFMQTLSQCTIPYLTANDCATWVLYCSESTFGYDGADFTAYADPIRQKSNAQSCSFYSDSFSNCIQRAIDDSVEIGQEPYVLSYQSPCSGSTNAVYDLVDYAHNYVVKPFCDAPNQSMNETCLPWMASAPPPTTTTTTATVATTTTAATTVVTTTKPSAPPSQSEPVSTAAAVVAAAATTATAATAQPGAAATTKPREPATSGQGGASGLSLTATQPPQALPQTTRAAELIYTATQSGPASVAPEASSAAPVPDKGISSTKLADLLTKSPNHRIDTDGETPSGGHRSSAVACLLAFCFFLSIRLV